MQSIVNVIEPAKDVSLLTLRDAKLGLNLFSVSNQNIDDQIQMMIEWVSDEAAVMCNRVFAKETCVEEVLELGECCKRLPLSHWPVRTDEPFIVTENGTVLVADTDYVLDAENGIIVRKGKSFWSLSTVVNYTGGYDLPFEAPLALRQAVILLTREAYNAAIRGDSTIRSIGHKEARVIYFDPNLAAKAAGAAGGKGGSPAMRAAGSILEAYTRYWV